MPKWSLKPAPSPKDPQRQELLIKGEMKDLLAVVRQFGSACGRPDRLEGEEYDFKLFLNKLSAEALDAARAFLQEMGGPAPEPFAAMPEIPSLQAPAAAPAFELPAPQLISLTPEPPAEVAPPPLPSPLVPAPSAGPSTPMSAEAKKPLHIGLAIDPKKNFEALLVGSFNRFAHAASASVVGSPGSMYNPLFIHGAPGVGKSHMLEAIGGGLSKAFSPEAVTLSTGARLASMVSRAAQTGGLAELDNFFGSKKALLIDDIHLLAISDANQAELAKIFAMFLGRNLQVVLTSLYAPRALGSLEEALKISFSKGWSVDMKVPGPDVQKEMILTALARYGIDVTNDETAIFHDRLGANYFESLRWVRRLSALKRIYAETSQIGDVNALINVVFEPLAGAVPSSEDLMQVQNFVPPPAQSGARNLAVLFPKGQEGMAPWLVAKFYEALARLKFPANFNHVLTASYDAEQPFGVPFQIGELCRNADASAALILGPAATAKVFDRVSEFSHAVGHILGSLDIAMGWIAQPSLKASVPFTLACLDILAPGLLQNKENQ